MSAEDPVVAAARAAMAAAPDSFQAMMALGQALEAARQFEEAETWRRRALEVRPRDPAAVRSLAGLMQAREGFAEALALAEDVLAAEPQHGEALVARGHALSGLGRYDAALKSYRAAMRSGHLALDGLVMLGATLAALGQYGAARETLDGVVALHPEAAAARFQRGVLRLSLRDFAGGWDDYEARWRAPRFIAESRAIVSEAMIPSLTTSPAVADLAAQRVLLVGEQGIGDQVMFASMVQDLARVAARVVLVCDPRLVALFRASFPDVEVFDPAEARIDTGEIDRVVPMGSLGSAFRRDPGDFPGQAYLRPRDEVAARWRERLGAPPERLRIGLSWRGGAAMTRRQARSLSLAELTPILDLPGCEFVSLQYGDTAAELAAFNAGRANPVRAFAPKEIEDFEQLAGLTASLDLVVSVQTSLVHLCGAIGQTCLTLVPRNAEWRYMARGDAMPWYRSVRLYRQGEPGAWAPVIQHVAADLAAR